MQSKILIIKSQKLRKQRKEKIVIKTQIVELACGIEVANHLTSILTFVERVHPKHKRKDISDTWSCFQFVKRHLNNACALLFP